MTCHKWTESEDNFLKENYLGTPTKKLMKLLNDEFNINVTESAVTNRLHKLKLRIGVNSGRFKKGNTPYNKGKTWGEYVSKEGQDKSREHLFKKGDRSFHNANHNEKPMFSERVDKDGYVLIKVNKKGAFVLKHRYIYEQHYGKIPKGYICMFLDGDTRNFDVNNLVIVTKHENLILNKFKLRYDATEVTESGIQLAKLIAKIQERKKR